jgi:hypothetical protein
MYDVNEKTDSLELIDLERDREFNHKPFLDK